MKRDKTIIRLGAVYIILVVFIIIYARHMDGDDIGSLLIAKMTSKDGLYPTTVYCSTEVPNYVGFVGIASALFGVISNFEIVYILSHALELTISFLLFYLFYKELNRTLDIIDIVILICPSACMMQFLWMEGYYIYAINSIVLMLLMLLYYLNQKYNPLLLLSVGGVLGLCLGLSGLKPFMWVWVPLFLAAVIINIFVIVEKQAGRKFLIFTGVSLFGSMLGYVFSKSVVEKRFSVPNYASMAFTSSSELGTRMLTFLGKLFEVFGYSNAEIPLMSAAGIYQFISILITMFVIYAAIYSIRRLVKNSLKDIEKFIVVVTIISSALMCFLLVFLKSDISSGYLVTTCFLWCMCFIIISRKHIDEESRAKSKLLNAGIYVGICLWGVSSLYFSYNRYILADMDRALDIEMVIDSIYNNDLKVGYASFWNGQRVTGKSNMDLKVANISINESEMNYFYWLSPKENYEPFAEEKSFVMVENGTEKDNFIRTANGGGVFLGDVICENDHYTVYAVYDDSMKSMLINRIKI